ncbi:MAG: hypothetical protein F4077_04260 [Gammaproteobacteria bacterium]|nr:hypothetical protein [Gammaproteobacteria bacterium]MYI76960.1 hypothetical protein [Gammaproteobacteria bacterium]
MSYYHPNVSILQLLGVSLGEYDLEVTAGERSWNLSVSANELPVGWNEISIINIESPGNVRVAVSNESDGQYVYADAIKWTYLDKGSSGALDSD